MPDPRAGAAAAPHHELGEREIQDGDMVVLDFGGLEDGYGSDTTRTVHVGEPEPGRFEVRIEDIVVATEDGCRRLNNTSHEMRIVT